MFFFRIYIFFFFCYFFNTIIYNICRVLIQNDIILDKDVIEIFKKHNNYVVIQDESIRNDLQEIVKIANRTLKMAQINRAKEEEKWFKRIV